MKKFVTSLLILTLLLTAIPTTSAQAAVKISETKIELVEGDTFSLKLTGTDETIIWNTTKKNIASVTSDGVVTAGNVGKAKITAKVGKKKYVCNVTVVKNIANIRPMDAFSFVNERILGYDFYVLQNYIYNGKSSYGDDFETTLTNLDADMIKLSQYNDSVSKFEGEEYDDLKSAWNTLYTEINTLYETIKENPPKINDGNRSFDLTNVKKYMDAYLDECRYFE
jgi:hypothetical protein